MLVAEQPAKHPPVGVKDGACVDGRRQRRRGEARVVQGGISVDGVRASTVRRPAGRVHARAGGVARLSPEDVQGMSEAAKRWSAGAVPAESLLSPEDAQLLRGAQAAAQRLRDAQAAARAPQPDGVAA